MADTIKKLGEAELEIMQVIWDSKTVVTSNYILEELYRLRKWQLSTLMTSLTWLADKGFVSCERSTGSNLYRWVISENDYKTGASRHFLEKLYDNLIRNMVASLYSNKAIRKSDVEELREFLDRLEKERSREEDQPHELPGRAGGAKMARSWIIDFDRTYPMQLGHGEV